MLKFYVLLYVRTQNWGNARQHVKGTGYPIIKVFFVKDTQLLKLLYIFQKNTP